MNRLIPTLGHLAFAAVCLCAVGTSLADAQPEPPATERWYAVQLHAHSRYSDGVHPIGTLARWAHDVGLDALAVTDHNTKRHLADPVFQEDHGVTLIPAYEWTQNQHHPNASGHCHVNVWGLKPDTSILPETLTRTDFVAAAGRQGVTIGANHPFEPRFPWPDENYSGVSTIEVWQWQYGLDEAPDTPLPPNARTPRHNWVEFLYRNSRAITQWQRVMRSGRKLTPVAVADFHVAGPQALGSPCTLVWSADRSVEKLLAGLRAGRVALVEAPRGPRVEIWGDGNRDGRFELPAGSDVATGAPFQVTVTGGKGLTLSLFDADGLAATQAVTSDPYRVQWPAAKPGFYWARLDRGAAYSRLAAMTGALHVR